FRSINLLPLIYIGLSIWQQRLMPKPLDEQQAQQMRTARWMTILFPILLYNYTGALALYMVCSTTVAIIEGRIVRAIDDREIAASAEPRGRAALAARGGVPASRVTPDLPRASHTGASPPARERRGRARGEAHPRAAPMARTVGRNRGRSRERTTVAPA